MAQGSFDNAELSAVLESRIATHSCGTPHQGRFTLCSCFWRDVFTDIHGRPPTGDHDPLWDPLFKAGFPLLRRISASSP